MEFLFSYERLCQQYDLVMAAISIDPIKMVEDGIVIERAEAPVAGGWSVPRAFLS